jgi:hypothetical protein
VEIRAVAYDLDTALPATENEAPSINRGNEMRLLVAAVALLNVLPAFAGTNSAIFFQVPTLDEVGLIGLVVAVGVAAGLVIRRRKK